MIGFTQSTSAPLKRFQRRNKDRKSLFLLLIVSCILLPVLLAVGISKGNDLQVVAIVLAVFGLITILSQPFVGLIIFIALLFTRPEEMIPALAGMHLTLLVACVTLIGMILQMSQSKTPLVSTPMTRLLWVFFLAAVVSAIPVGTINDAVMDTLRLVMLALLILNLVRTRSSYHHLVSALLVFSSYLALYTVYLFHSGMVIMQDDVERTQATGIFSDPNDLATTFVAGLALAISRLLQARGKQKISYGILSSILLYAIILTNSRGGVMALMAMMFGYFAVSKLPKPAKIAMVVVGIAGILAAGGRMTNFNSQEASANSRFWFWKNGCEMLLGHPLLGVGYGQFMTNNGGMTAHNSFVLCFAELGIIGYFCWMGCIYCGFRKQPKAETTSAIEQADTDSMTSAIDKENIFGSRMALTAYLVASFWLSHTYSPILFVYMSLPVSAQIVTGNMEIRKWRDRPLSGNEIKVIGVICVVSFVLIRMLSDRLR